MNQFEFGTPISREEAKKVTVGNRYIQCETHADCPGDGLCVNRLCHCVIECAMDVQEIYESNCSVSEDKQSMSYDWNGASYHVTCYSTTG